jgi:hypothetical protein
LPEKLLKIPGTNSKHQQIPNISPAFGKDKKEYTIFEFTIYV